MVRNSLIEVAPGRRIDINLGWAPRQSAKRLTLFSCAILFYAAFAAAIVFASSFSFSDSSAPADPIRSSGNITFYWK
ncbi:MAG: hypothetical protein IT290_05470 [Deltaproteobacteria bacterium]|nr:hypothetical protein [Deltaproteobacteria bacterium]